MIDRRKMLVGTAWAGGTALFAPALAFAQAATDRRLLFVIQRGAADGLDALAPVGDPAFAGLRGAMAEKFANAQQVDSFFALNPAFERIGAMAAKGEALFAHAVATSYRDRSHFDAQNLLESGGLRAFDSDSGWLNRLLGLISDKNGTVPRALALSQTVPLALRGDRAATNYAPSVLPEATGNLMDRVTRLYDSDPQLSALLDQALATRAMAGDTTAQRMRNPAVVGELAASLMRGPDGARVLMVESDGWDSHANQAFQFRRNAQGLDGLLGAFADGIGDAWADTLVLVATEFGRTVRPNGTGGTDHGTAGAAMMLGGRVAGGRVLSDWPGLGENDLLDGRDLRPTMALEAVLAGAVAEHFALDPQLALRTLFPGRDIRAAEGLIRA